MQIPKTRARLAPCCEPIEPRLLYSADVGPLALAAEAGQAYVQMLDGPASASSVQAGGTTQQAAAEVRELVVIDSRVPQSDELIASFDRQREQGRPIDVLVLDPDHNGIAQVSAWLEQAREQSDVHYSAIHLLAHAEPGSLQLGSSALDLAALRSSASQVAGWGQSLTGEADLLLYGCELAGDVAGRELVDALAALTGADVAASVDRTGQAALGGDWDLEYRQGQVDAADLLDVTMQQQWQAVLAATPVTATGDAIVNQTTAGVQSTVGTAAGRQVAVNGAGVTVAVWRDQSANTNGAIVARLFDASGNALTDEIQVSSNNARTQDEPSVAIDAAGNFVVVWTQGNSADGSGLGIFGRTFDAAGNSTSAEFLINQVTAEDQWRAQVAINPNTASGIDFYVTWSRYFQSGSSSGVQARGFTWSGAPVISEFDVNTTGTNDQENSSIAYAGNGTALIVWQSQYQDGSGWGIYGQRLNASGGLSGGEFRINTTLAGDQINPDVSADAAGNFVVVWTQATGGSAGSDVMGQRISAAGNKIGSEFMVSSSSAHDQTDAAVAMGADGRFLVTWQAMQQDQGATAGIYAREFRPDGTAAAGEFLVNDTVAGDQLAPSIAYAGERAVIVWSGRSDSSLPIDSDGVFMRAYSVVSPRLLVTSTGTQTHESGATQITLSVALNAAPTQDVMVNLSVTDSTEASLSGTGQLLFSATNWNIAQEVRINGVDDSLADANITYFVNLLSNSSLAEFNNLTATSGAFVNVNNDTVNQVIVDTNTDVIDGDTSSLEALLSNRGDDGAISLAEAIRATNQTPNGPGGPDYIGFNLTSAASHRISIVSALDSITESVVIDGKSDPAYAGTPIIELINAGNGTFNGLTLAMGSAGSLIRGLAIEGFAGNGIEVRSAFNTIEFNHIGVNPATLAPSGNFLNGIALLSGANSNTVSGNTIGANSGAGVRIDAAHNNRLIGNFIGTNQAGTVDLHNAGNGITIVNSATLNRIGGVTTPEGNRIAFNPGRAIAIGNFGGTSSSNSIVGNLIYGNGFGIDLDPSSTNFTGTPVVNPNDIGDTDNGPNGLQNRPVITRAEWLPGSLMLSAELDSTPNTSFRIEFFALAVGDASGHGQAQVYLGFANVTTDASGHAQVSRTLTTGGGLSLAPVSGAQVTATATRTDSTYQNLFDTSEFAANVMVSEVPIQMAGGTVVENAADGTLVATLSYAAPGTFSYSLVSDAGGRFTIDAASGELRVAPAALLDFEATGSHQVVARVDNGAGFSRQDTFTLVVSNVNEAPQILAPANAVTDEDQLLLLAINQGNGIDLSDPDLTNGPMTVSLNATGGRFTLADVSGLTFSIGDGIDATSAQFTGSLADLRRALSALQFNPVADFAGAGALQVSIRDAGNPSLADAHQIDLTIRAVNDAPAVVTAALPNVDGGQTLVIDSSRLAGSDIDNTVAELNYLLVQAPIHGVLMRNGVALQAGDRFGQTDVDAGHVRYQAQAVDSIRTDSIGLQLSDGQAAVPLNLSVKVSPVVALTSAESGYSSNTSTSLLKTGSGARTGTSADGTGVAAASVVPMAEGNGSPGLSGAALNNGARNAVKPLAGLASAAPPAHGNNGAIRGDASERRGETGQQWAGRTALSAEPGRRFGLELQSRRETAMASAVDPKLAQQQAESTFTNLVRRNDAFRHELDRLRERLEDRVTLERNLTGSTATLTASASVGYIIWLLRGGVLLSSLLASVPAWVSLDPLPILSSAGRRPGETDDDDSLQGMLKKASDRKRSVAAPNSGLAQAPGDEVAVTKSRLAVA